MAPTICCARISAPNGNNPPRSRRRRAYRVCRQPDAIESQRLARLVGEVAVRLRCRGTLLGSNAR